MKRIVFVICLVTVVVSGCSYNLGNKALTDVGRYMMLQPNVSTKRDVYAQFGQPHDVRQDSRVWVYYYTKATMHGATFVPIVGLLAGGLNTDNTITRFSFDEGGRYTEVSSSNQVNYVNQWEGIAKGTAKLLTEKQTERVRTEMNALGVRFDPTVARSVKDITVAH